MTTRPLTVTVCGQPFAIEWEDRPGKKLHEDSDSYFDLGMTALPDQKLIIRTVQGEYQLRDTMLHEILHAIVLMTAQGDRFKGHEKHPEEQVVAATATALLAVLRGNPELVAWLVEEVG